MKTKQQAALIVYDEQSSPTHVVIFEGRDISFYSLERCGVDDIEKIINNNLVDKKIPAMNCIGENLGPKGGDDSTSRTCNIRGVRVKI